MVPSSAPSFNLSTNMITDHYTPSIDSYALDQLAIAARNTGGLFDNSPSRYEKRNNTSILTAQEFMAHRVNREKTNTVTTFDARDNYIGPYK